MDLIKDAEEIIEEHQENEPHVNAPVNLKRKRSTAAERGESVEDVSLGNRNTTERRQQKMVLLQLKREMKMKTTRWT
jgi:hypothetical protein